MIHNNTYLTNEHHSDLKHTCLPDNMEAKAKNKGESTCLSEQLAGRGTEDSHRGKAPSVSKSQRVSEMRDISRFSAERLKKEQYNHIILMKTSPAGAAFV